MSEKFKQSEIINVETIIFFPLDLDTGQVNFIGSKLRKAEAHVEVIKWYEDSDTLDDGFST